MKTTMLIALIGLSVIASGNAAAQIWFQDLDGDGFGNAMVSFESSTQPLGYVIIAGDCWDTNPAIHPAAVEICNNGGDEDCDGWQDNGCTAWFADGDGDGWGDPSTVIQSSTQPAGYVGRAHDCDDGDSQINPDMQEICGDLIDNNCDGIIDNTCNNITDSDGDGVSNYNEINVYGTNPFMDDTDGDGCSDGYEIPDPLLDPLDPNDCGAVDRDATGWSRLKAIYR